MPLAPYTRASTRWFIAMGNLSSHEALALRWPEISNDPTLRDLPYKIELNSFGKIEMSPGNNRHARLQGEIAY